MTVPSPKKSPPAWSQELFEQITDLLAEALYQDFQQHRNVTVHSPMGINSSAILTDSFKQDYVVPKQNEDA